MNQSQFSAEAERLLGIIQTRFPKETEKKYLYKEVVRAQRYVATERQTPAEAGRILAKVKKRLRA